MFYWKSDANAKWDNKKYTAIIPFNYANLSLKPIQMYKTNSRSGKNYKHWFNVMLR